MKIDDIDRTLLRDLSYLRFDDEARDAKGNVIPISPEDVHLNPHLFGFLHDECNIMPWKKKIEVVNG